MGQIKAYLIFKSISKILKGTDFQASLSQIQRANITFPSLLFGECNYKLICISIPNRLGRSWKLPRLLKGIFYVRDFPDQDHVKQ